MAVVAETAAQAADAVLAVEVDAEPLDAVIDAEAALQPEAPVQFDAIGSNLAVGLRDREGPDPLDDAEVVVRGRFVNQRIAVVPMEGNAIAVLPGDDGDGHELTVYVSTQMPHLFQRLAAPMLGLPEEAIRVITPHVGGGFGGKAGVAAEHAVAMAAARRLGRPLTWVETRSENMVAMPHGRAQVQYVEMGFTRDGTITGMHAYDPRRRRRLRRLRRRAGPRPHPLDGPGRLPHPEDRLRRRRRPHQHHADGRVPRRRPTRGRGVPRADHGHGRRRARPRPGGDPPAQPAGARRVPASPR